MPCKTANVGGAENNDDSDPPQKDNGIDTKSIAAVVGIGAVAALATRHRRKK